MLAMEFKDLRKQYMNLQTEIDFAIHEVIQRTDFISGNSIKELEEELAEYVGSKYCVACANGTDALILALQAWDVGIGDAVFVPDFTFFASGEVVAFVGATPIFVDVEEDTYNIDCKKLEKSIIRVLNDGRLVPKVIVAVDLFGQPANYEEIRHIANRYNLKILEDGAQGFGGSMNGKQACSFGDISTTSFFPVKPLGCYGDGGALFLNDAQEESIIRSLQNHGKGESKYDNVRIGMNSRLDTLQAAILKVKFKAFLNYELARINELANYYCSKLRNVVGVPYIKKGYTSSWAQYTIRLKDKKQREELHKYLAQNNVPSMIYYPIPMHRQHAFSDYAFMYDEEEYEITNRLCDTVLSIPLYPYMEDTDRDCVVNMIKGYLKPQ